MVEVTKMVLDVLKPHHPDGLEFTAAVAEVCPDCRVSLSVIEVDEKTETVSLRIEGTQLSYDAIADVIANMGGTVHSIDEVEAINAPPTDTAG